MSGVLALAAAQAAQAPPWWGVTVVSGAFALGGALLGLFVTGRRDRRVDARRWEKDVREVSARLLSQADVTAFTETKAEERMELFTSVEELQLVAPQPVARAAEVVAHAAMAVARTSETDVDARLEAVARLREAKRAFINEGRKAVGAQPLGRRDGTS